MGIFVIDDQPLMRDAVAKLICRIQLNANIIELDRPAAVGSAASEHGALSLITVDLKQPDNVGAEAVIRLKKAVPVGPQQHLPKNSQKDKNSCRSCLTKA